MPEEDTLETYDEDFLPEGVVTEDKTAAVDKNTIANTTVDADKNVDMDNNLPSVDEASPDHFISQDYLDNMKVVDLKESLKARGLSIPGKKSDLKLQLQQEISAGVKIISKE